MLLGTRGRHQAPRNKLWIPAALDPKAGIICLVVKQ